MSRPQGFNEGDTFFADTLVGRIEIVGVTLPATDTPVADLVAIPDGFAVAGLRLTPEVDMLVGTTPGGLALKILANSQYYAPVYRADTQLYVKQDAAGGQVAIELFLTQIVSNEDLPA